MNVSRYDHLLTTTYRTQEEERELLLLMRLYTHEVPVYTRAVAA